MANQKLFDEFPPTEREQWMSVVERDLKGADYDKKLVWRSPEGLAVQPFYRQDDLTSLEYLKNQAPGAYPFVRGKTGENNRWAICQPVTRTAIADANAVALKALATGAEAVSFGSGACEGHLYGQRVTNLADFEALLAGVDLEKVGVHLDWGAAAPQAAAYLVALAKKKGLKASELSGSVEFDPLGNLSAAGKVPSDAKAFWDGVSDFLKEARAALPGMRLVVIHTDIYLDAGSNLSQDLALVLSQAVEIVAALTDRGWKADDVLGLLGVKAAVSNSYFMEIAFFRALRLLWASMASAFGASEASAELWVHGVTADVNKTVYDPHVNILRQTTETMSAVIGGVDVMSVRPWDEPVGTTSEASERLARNTQLVIREESGLDHAVDPSAGSFYIENLTDSLAAKAWELFQQLEAAGGYLAALSAGTVAEWVSASRAALDKGVASRRSNLLGTNQFPNADERMGDKLASDDGHELSDAQQAAAPASLKDMVAAAAAGLSWGTAFVGDKEVEPTPQMRRLSESYEELRLKVEGMAKQPTVYLWTFGNLAFRKARAGFCQNLYACAGLKIVEGSGSDDVAENLKAIEELGAEFIVFCSSDAEYPEKVPALVEATKAKFDSATLIVAGYPKDAIDALQKAGIAEFVHVKTEAVSYLTQCVERVGGAK